MNNKTTSIKQLVIIGALVLAGICWFTLQAGQMILDNMASCEEVQRVTSPDRRFDAILIETNGGATTTFGYLVYVTKAGQPFRRHDTPLWWLPNHQQQLVGSLVGAIRNSNAYGANLKWTTAKVLSVEYLTCDQKEGFKNVLFDGHPITIQDKSGILDATALSGGMGYVLASKKSSK